MSKSKEIVLSEVIARVGGKDNGGGSFSVEDLKEASEMDDDLIFDEGKGELKLVMRREK